MDSGKQNDMATWVPVESHQGINGFKLYESGYDSLTAVDGAPMIREEGRNRGEA